MVTGIGATAQQQVAGTPATTQIPPAEPVKRSSDNRRSNKPIMEKRRRARINNCLNELKSLILDAMKKDPARHSKLEKADILEMTVKHLENLQRQQSAMSQATDPSVMNKFKAGFNECAQEVGRFPEIDPIVKRRLMQHLSNCINGAVKSELPKRGSSASQQQVHILPSPPSSPEQQHQELGHLNLPLGHHAHHPAHQLPLSAIQSASGNVFMTNGVSGSSVQLIPTKLANGSIAFVLPGQTLPPQTTSNASASSAAAALAPLPMLVPIPTRTASTGSASSSHSGASSLYERIPREHATSPYHAPPSPANSTYEPMDCLTSQQQHQQQQQQYHHLQLQLHHHQQQQQQQQQLSFNSSTNSSSSSSSSGGAGSPDSPLSLVMKKQQQQQYHVADDDEDQEMRHDEDGKPWRPW